MPKDFFETVTALDSARDEAMKKRAGVPSAPKKVDETPAPPKGKEKIDHAPALKEIDDEMYNLREQGRALMKKNEQNTPSYDALVARNRALRKKRQFLEDSSKD